MLLATFGTLKRLICSHHFKYFIDIGQNLVHDLKKQNKYNVRVINIFAKFLYIMTGMLLVPDVISNSIYFNYCHILWFSDWRNLWKVKYINYIVYNTLLCFHYWIYNFNNLAGFSNFYQQVILKLNVSKTTFYISWCLKTIAIIVKQYICK